jgi:fucose permease
MSVGAYFSNGITSVYFLILTGFATAMFWGTIWGLSLRGLGKFTKIGGAMLLMGVIGGAVFPVVFGRLLDFNTQFPQNATLILIPLYLVLTAFSKWGYKLENWSFLIFKNV